MTSTLQKALDLVDAFQPVFPCHPETKAPLIPNGFYGATCDPKQVKAWWTENPDALIGRPTGDASGLAVIDVDVKDGRSGMAWFQDHQDQLAGARIVKTRSGGLHAIMQHAPGLRCSAGAVAPGVDIRASGGYVIDWQAHGCEVIRDCPPPPMPPEVRELLLTRQRIHTDAITDIEDLAAPSVADVVALFAAMPNPLEADRGCYINTLLAAKGALDGLQAKGGDDPDGLIREAACQWALRWEGGAAEDAYARWDGDICLRTITHVGWPHLLRGAHALGLDVSSWTIADKLDDFVGALPLPEPDFAAEGFHWEGTNPYGKRAWMVDGLLPDRGIGLMPGSWHAGKTFAAIDLGVSVATGTNFAGREVDRRAGVLWIASESEHDIPDRLTAARMARPDLPDNERIPFMWVGERKIPHLTADGAAKALIAKAKAATEAFMQSFGLPLGLVIIDTMAAAAGWEDENSNAEVTQVTNVLREVARATSAVVLAIDHYGKAKDSGTRGASAKEGNVDFVLAMLCEKSATGVITNRRMNVRKLKWGRVGAEIPFQLIETVPLDHDAKGRPITTCNILWEAEPETMPALDAAPAAPDPSKLPSWARDWFSAFLEASDGGAETTADAWAQKAVEHGLANGGKSRAEIERLGAKFRKARTVLIRAGLVIRPDPNGQIYRGSHPPANH